MDVNGIEQNVINTNAYSSNSSGYIGTNTEVAIPQVQQVATQGSSENQGENKEYNKKDLDNALKKINNFLKGEHTHAEYSYHKEMKTTMIKIIDEDTNEVILEVPPEKILDMVAYMCKQVGLFDRKA